MSGQLIVIEGLDGSGKATQTEILYEALKEKNKVRKISFPNYDSDSSALVRMYLNGELGSRAEDVNAYAASSFYAVDRYASYKKEWKQFLESGGLVIADRYTTSNAIYQCSKLPKEQWDAYRDWLFDYEYNLLGIPEPALVIYLRVDLEISQKLLSGRYENDENKKDLHEKDNNYLKHSQMAADYCARKCGWRTIDCCQSGEMRRIKEISDEILRIVNEGITTSVPSFRS